MSTSSRNSLDLEEDMTLLANEKAYTTGKRQKRRFFCCGGPIWYSCDVYRFIRIFLSRVCEDQGRYLFSAGPWW